MGLHTLEICAGVGMLGEGLCMKPIPGYEGRYSATEEGEIYSHISGKQLRSTPSGGSQAYRSVCIGGKSRSVHELVLLAFKGEKPAGMEARHLDGDGCNNRPTNLEWSTHAVNIADKKAHGTMAAGERHGNCIYGDDQIREIRRLRKDGLSFPRIASAIGCSISHAYRVVNHVDRKGA